jgi:hypothetical protein
MLITAVNAEDNFQIIFSMRMKIKISPLILAALINFGCGRELPTEDNTSDFPVSIPEGVRIYKAHDGEIGIEWIKFKETNLKGFNIYRSINNKIKFELYRFTPDNFFLDDSLEYDSTYNYKITSVSVSGKESGYSATVGAKPVNLYNPSPTFRLKVIAHNWRSKPNVNLFWEPSYDSDVGFYEVYRDTINSFSQSSDNLAGTIRSNTFIDSSGLSILKRYYYKIITVDKGGLKSRPSAEQSDIILDPPKAVYPPEGEILASKFHFVIVTCGAKADYKIIIQSNQLFDITDQINFSSDRISDTLSINYYPGNLERYKTYYWRAAAYTNSTEDANCFSELKSFTIIPGN